MDTIQKSFADGKEKELVSIIVPVYQVEEYLEECVDSLINQTYSNIEIILVDDGSRDRCPELCDNYCKIDHRIKVIHQANMGLPAARNSGLKIAAGEWILFVDSDDWISYDAIELLMNIQSPSLDIIFFDYTRETDYHKVVNATGSGNKTVHLDENDFELLIQDAFSPTQAHCKAFRRSKTTAWSKLYNHDFLKSNNLQFFEEVRIHEDVPFAAAVFSKAKKGMYLDKKIYCYRCRIGSITNNYKENYENDLLPLIDRMKALSADIKDTELAKKLLNERMCVLFLFIMKRNYCNPYNPYSYSKRRKACWNLKNRKEFRAYIKEVHVGKFSIEKKIAALCVKMNIFCLPNFYFRVICKKSD